MCKDRQKDYDNPPQPPRTEEDEARDRAVADVFYDELREEFEKQKEKRRWEEGDGRSS